MKDTPIQNLIIYGQCSKCGGYLMNQHDDFTAYYAEPNIVCQVCGYHAIDVETNLRELMKKEGD